MCFVYSLFHCLIGRLKSCRDLSRKPSQKCLGFVSLKLGMVFWFFGGGGGVKVKGARFELTTLWVG